MGISGKKEHLIDLNRLNVPLIKRYSGGGTVVVDEHTLFISFILNADVINRPLFPKSIYEWSERLYQAACPLIQLKENDYIIENQKVGGNAQYIRKDRFVHHTTFLWDFCLTRMNMLLLPTKIPSYRNHRSHEAFLTRLKFYLPEMSTLASQLCKVLEKQMDLIQIDYQEIKDVIHRPHRQATQYIDIECSFQTEQTPSIHPPITHL